MPLRLLFVGDQHFDSVPPASRKDNYLESLQLKVQEIRQLAIDHKVHGVLWLGDLLNRQDGHRVPYHITNWLMSYFGSYPSNIANWLTMGNHDVKATAQNWRRQPIGSLVLSKVVIPLWDDVSDDNPWGAKSYTLTGDGDALVELSGKQFSYDSDLPQNRPSYYSRGTILPGRLPDPSVSLPYHIMACHTQVVPDGESAFGHFTNPKDLDAGIPPGYEANLYICGHLHDFYGSFGHGRIRFLNFGSLARGSIDEFNLKRKVKIGLVEIIANGQGAVHVQVEEIELKSAKPAEEVFYVEELHRKKKRVEELDRLAEMLNAGTIADEFRIINAEEALEVVLKSKHVRPSVEKLVRDKVNSAKAELESG